MDFSGDPGMLLVRNTWFGRQWIHLLLSAWLLFARFLRRGGLGFRGVLSPFRCREEKCAQPMLLVAVLLCAARTWKSELFSMRSTSWQWFDDGSFFAAQCGIFRPPLRS